MRRENPPRRTGVRAEILRDPPNYVIAPAAGLLLVEDVASDRPVQHDQLRVQRPGGARLGLADPDAETLDQLAVGCARGDSVNVGDALPYGMAAHSLSTSLSQTRQDKGWR